MRRKILIAEQTDTLRSIAETVLRQNGYDVIAVSAAEKAREVLELTQPDLIIVGADLAGSDGTPYHERIRADQRTANVPLLLFEPVGKADTVYPDEVIIPRPFDPRDFLHKVTVFLGGQENSKATSADLGGSVVDDDFLDAALGLDHLDVTDSEVMDKTVVGRRRRDGSGDEKLIGLDTGPVDPSGTQGSVIESLAIDEDSSQIKSREARRAAPPAAASGKLEILTDQFGLAETPAKADESGAVHDYDWFVDAMKNDVAEPGGHKASDSGSISITDPSDAVNPITAVPVNPNSKAATTSKGVDHFIDEFKKEMEQVRSAEDLPAELAPPLPSAAVDKDELPWEETLEQIGPAQVDLFIKEFAHEVGAKVAQIMTDRIDPDKLLRLIKSEILERQKKNAR